MTTPNTAATGAHRCNMRKPMSRTTYTDEQRDEAVVLWREVGAAEAARRLGIPSGTIASWANRSGATEGCEESRRKTEAALARRKRSLEERRTKLVELMGEIAELGAERELELLEKTGSHDLRSVVGARTRAIHDLQLLSGGATSRADLTDRDEVLGMRDELAQRRKTKAS